MSIQGALREAPHPTGRDGQAGACGISRVAEAEVSREERKILGKEIHMSKAQRHENPE
jgi:hypothetical protein